MQLEREFAERGTRTRIVPTARAARLTMDREVMRIRDSLIPKYSELVYYGFWFHPAKEALDAFVKSYAITPSPNSNSFPKS